MLNAIEIRRHFEGVGERGGVSNRVWREIADATQHVVAKLDVVRGPPKTVGYSAIVRRRYIVPPLVRGHKREETKRKTERKKPSSSIEKNG